MNFNKISDQEKQTYAELLFGKLSSEKDLKDWIEIFFDLQYPNTITDKETNSNPVNAIWEVYQAFLLNDGKVPGAIWMSARECLKTVSVAILEIILMLHFSLEIAHASAVESQSQVCLRYISGFLAKIQPLLDTAGWQNQTQNKRTFEFVTPDGKRPFIKVVICSPKGMNSLHANLLCVDELDLADPTALDEGKNIVGYSRGVHGFTLFLSTRKYSFGNMSKVIDNADELKYKLLRWNILDVTERCGPERHKPELKKVDMYVAKSLPLKQITTEEYGFLTPPEQAKFDLLKDVHGGCVGCPLLPICRTRLSTLPEEAVGGFYKPIGSVIQKFRENSPEIAEAQLLCWKPGSEGLVYPRLINQIDAQATNVISLRNAIQQVCGIDPISPSMNTLLSELQRANIPFYAGVDWGFSNDSVILVVALLPDGQVWVIDCFSSPGLEFSDVLEQAMKFRDLYNIQRWFCDPAMPSHLKSFNKNGMKSPNFTKDVVAGIEAVRSKIVNAAGNRLLKIVSHDNTRKVITAMIAHRFILDGQGNITPKPDDEPGIADICDSLRYLAQNLFPVRGTYKPGGVWAGEAAAKDGKIPTANEQMMQEIRNRVTPGEVVTSTKKKGGFHFSF